jgi:hypothetical protein
MKNNRSVKPLLAAGVLCAFVAVLIGRPIADWLREKSGTTERENKLTLATERVAERHLDWAQKESERAIDEHAKALDAFFADSKKNTQAFAVEALSWSSKWRLAADYVPFTSKDLHQRFIREKFEEYIFNPSQLEDAVKQVVKNYLAHVRSIEGRMLVDLRADVADFPSAYDLARIDESKVQAAYDEAVSRASEVSSDGWRAEIGADLVSMIVGEVLTQVGVRLGVSAGILGTGAASSWSTLGIGAVVGLIVDQIVSLIWDWWADPKGNLARDLDNKLDEMNRLIVDGSTDVKGVRARLQEFARERAGLRRQAVLGLLQIQSGETKQK